MLIIPKPVPPVVTTSPEEFLSLDIPETGWPKSQKYLKVCFCTSSSNCSSVIRGNLSVESIAVIMDKVFPEFSLTISCDCKPVEIVNVYFVRGIKEVVG